MHYHYFTLEQRDALARQIRDVASHLGYQPDKAVEALRSPAYGVCEACEADIPFVRLLEDPMQRLCARCQRERPSPR